MEKNVAQLLNDQINKELYSAYLYLDMSNYYEDEGLSGFAAWYRKQAEEEQEHAMKIYDYLHDNGEKVTLEAKIKKDLGADSLDILQLLMRLEDDYGVVIPDQALAGFETVGDVVKYLDSLEK